MFMCTLTPATNNGISPEKMIKMEAIPINSAAPPLAKN